MKPRIAVASLLLLLAVGACSTENPVGPEARPSAPAMEGTGNWMGSGH
jgi:hypothetical protein